MWWGIGFGALIWIVLFVWLGLRTLRNGHGWMFFLGIFLPLLWIIGAFMQPARSQESDAPLTRPDRPACLRIEERELEAGGAELPARGAGATTS